jgi:CMP-N-acetylneuraminic acid synthetase
MRVLGLIPARGGSKSIPRKNIRPLCGKPLLQYTAEAALAARHLSRVILSTDDEEIAEVGRRCGVEVPFKRPKELARDDTPMLSVVQHAVNAVEGEGDRFEAVCLLQPITPLRRHQTIDACIELLVQSGADAVVTILPVPAKYNPHWVYFKDEDGMLHLGIGETEPISRRQDLPPAFHREGSVYVTRWHVVKEQNTLYGKRLVGLPVSPEENLNIDTPEDWTRAEKLIEQQNAPS